MRSGSITGRPLNWNIATRPPGSWWPTVTGSRSVSGGGFFAIARSIPPKLSSEGAFRAGGHSVLGIYGHTWTALVRGSSIRRVPKAWGRSDASRGRVPADVGPSGFRPPRPGGRRRCPPSLPRCAHCPVARYGRMRPPRSRALLPIDRSRVKGWIRAIGGRAPHLRGISWTSRSALDPQGRLGGLVRRYVVMPEELAPPPNGECCPRISLVGGPFGTSPPTRRVWRAEPGGQSGRPGLGDVEPGGRARRRALAVVGRAGLSTGRANGSKQTPPTCGRSGPRASGGR
jgi:hypothetical protein